MFNLKLEEMATKYSKKASRKVASAQRRRKKGTLKSGSGRTVKSRKQATAIALSEARKAGMKVPPKKKAAKKKTAKKRTAKKKTAKRGGRKKSR